MKQDVYQDADFARFYEWTTGTHAEDIPFYLEIAEQHGPRILECGCGTGRISIPLAEAGNTVTALDYSQAMLDLLQQKLKALPANISERVRPVKADMVDHRLPERFDVIMIPLSSIFHIHTASARHACFANAAAHLAENGILVIDVNSAEYMRTHEVGEYFMVADWTDAANGTRIEEWSRKLDLDQDAHTIRIQHEIREIPLTGSSKVFTWTQNYTWLAPEEIDPLFSDTGLSQISIFSDYERTYYDPCSERMIVTAAF